MLQNNQNLQNLKIQLESEEQQRKSLLSLFTERFRKDITLAEPDSPDFIGFTTDPQQEVRAKKEYYELLQLFKAVGMTFTFSKKRNTCFLGYKDKVLIFQREGSKYYVVSRKLRLNITRLIKELQYTESDTPGHWIKMKSVSEKTYEKVTGLQAVFFDNW